MKLTRIFFAFTVCFAYTCASYAMEPMMFSLELPRVDGSEEDRLKKELFKIHEALGGELPRDLRIPLGNPALTRMWLVSLNKMLSSSRKLQQFMKRMTGIYFGLIILTNGEFIRGTHTHELAENCYWEILHDREEYGDAASNLAKFCRKLKQDEERSREDEELGDD